MEDLKRRLPALFSRAADGVGPLVSADQFGAFYGQTQPNVLRYIYGLLGGPREDVEDLTAETYSRAWKSREQFRGDENAALGWVLTIARRLVIDARRKEKAELLGEDLDAFVIPSQEPGLEQQALTREQRGLLWKSLQALPMDQREMIVLRYILGWKVDAIAAHLRKNENAVYVAVHRAMARLRANWREIAKDETP